jgi:hypothetical protein
MSPPWFARLAARGAFKGICAAGWHALKGRGEAIASMNTPFANPQGVPPLMRMNSRAR